MKISEVIAHLQEDLQLHGDLEVWSSGAQYSGDFEEVRKVYCEPEARYDQDKKKWIPYGPNICRIST